MPCRGLHLLLHLLLLRVLLRVKASTGAIHDDGGGANGGGDGGDATSGDDGGGATTTNGGDHGGGDDDGGGGEGYGDGATRSGCSWRGRASGDASSTESRSVRGTFGSRRCSGCGGTTYVGTTCSSRRSAFADRWDTTGSQTGRAKGCTAGLRIHDSSSSDDENTDHVGSGGRSVWPRPTCQRRIPSNGAGQRGCASPDRWGSSDSWSYPSGAGTGRGHNGDTRTKQHQNSDHGGSCGSCGASVDASSCTSQPGN